MMLMGHRSTISGIEILEINETDAAKKSALTTQCFSNKIRRTTAATNTVHLDASTLSAILLNPSRMLPSSSLLSITNEQTKGNINFNCSYCTNDYSNNNNNNNTMYSSSSSSSRNNDKSKVCHLHMQQNEDKNEAYEKNAENFLCFERQKIQKNHQKGEQGDRTEDGVEDENNKNNNRNHHSCSSSSSISNDSHSSSRILHAKTKQLHWWWCTCFVVVICLSLPSTTNMQPQDFVSLPKSSKLSPSVSSRLSTSLSQTNSLLFTPMLTTTTTTTATIVTLENITSGTSSATFMQSTAHTRVTKDYLLERQRNQQRQQQSVHQQRQHLKLMTTLRSLHARKRRRRSMLSSHYDESNGTTSRNANLTVNLDDNNNNNGTHYFTNNNNNNNNNHNIECPSYNENSACPCYKFEDGLFLECPGTTAMSLRSTLERISSPIHSLSIYDFDRSVTSLSQDVFQAGVNIRHLQFSHSHLETLKDNSLKHVRASLESLSIVNGKLMQIPTRALNSMQKLSALDFDYNEITKMDNYGFYGLRLSKLNIKGNRLQSLPEHAFNGLEEYMQEIDLSENSLRTFPLLSLRKLDYLRILRLSNNKISTFYGDITLATNNASAVVGLRLPSLIFLDLSSNEFTEIVDESFHTFPQLKTLSLYANQIEVVQSGSFKSLRELMSLDMSHNRIISLDPKLFDKNIRLQTVDLSHNHIHSISGVFSNLPQLREIFLSENNILELPADAFANSSNVDVIYLESNAISHVDPNVFSSLVNLDHLYLRSNFIPLVPVTLFDRCQKLTSLSLDNNEIQDLEIGMFRKLELLREIRLHNNRIRRIRKGVFEPLPALQELHVQQNNIEDIEPGAFERLTNLQHINLQDNQLTVLEDIFPRELVNSSLLSVQFDTNYLHKIHQLAFRQQYRVQIMWLRDNGLTRLEKNMFVDLKHLGRLYLSNNQIRDIDRDTFTPLKNLTLLDMSENRLKQLRREYFSTLQSLEELNLSTNYIEAIESNTFSKLKKLRILDLSNNPLTTIAKDVFDEELPLTQLNLRNTSLRKIDIYTFKPLPNLNELNLEMNYFSPSNVQLLDVPSLRGLYLSHNDFSDAHGNGALESNMFEKLRSLQHLSMANCSIATIPAELFLRNTNLVKLDLCDNLLTSINRNIFSGLNVFKELRLCRNNLIEFPHIALYNLSTLEYLDLSRNQLTSVDFFKLSGTLNLRQLNLRENKISTLTGFNAVNLTQLDNVDLSGNLLLSLPANFLRHSINLQRVDLSSNRFLQIPSTALSDISIPRLSWLNLTANPINKIYTVKEERYPYLKELYICHTNLSILTSKDFESFQALQHLHLVKNRIMRISPGAFKSLSNLLTLDISINELELLPKERLQGLRILRLLNISHNSLKELEEFSSDLSNLQICDLSFNQLDRISKKTFRNLHSLTELHLMGNRMTVLSTEAFRFLRKLQVLDLRKNYFELITVDALKPLETNLKTLKIEENPLHCSCDAQKLWEWLRDHRKWALASDKINYLKCEQPAELRGKIFARMEPQQFCDAPLIPKIAIQDIQPYSVVVSWQSREHLGLNGYEIVYYITTDGIDIDELKGKRLNGSANSAKLTKLSSNTRYHICVIGTGNWLSEPVVHALQKIHFNETAIMQRDEAYSTATGAWHKQPHQMDDVSDMDLSSLEPQQQQALIENTIVTDTHILRDVLKNSHISACTDVQTLDSTPSLIADENSLARNGFLHSILTRRLGLIVGCCLGIIVFIVMISVLSYVKLKKQRLESAKRQATLPQEYISYRHFSIPNDELRSAAALPGGISAHISGTSLSTSITTATATTPLSNALPLKSINEDSGGTGSEANLSLDGGDVSVGKHQQQQQQQQQQRESSVKGTSLEGSVLTTAANSHNHHQVVNLQHMLHHHHHAHLQQQANNHIGGNGNVLGYMAAGVVLGANHLNSH